MLRVRSTSWRRSSRTAHRRLWRTSARRARDQDRRGRRARLARRGAARAVQGRAGYYRSSHHAAGGCLRAGARGVESRLPDLHPRDRRRGNRIARRLRARAAGSAGRKELRMRIEHSQILDAAEIPRFGRSASSRRCSQRTARPTCRGAGAHWRGGTAEGAYVWRTLMARARASRRIRTFRWKRRSDARLLCGDHTSGREAIRGKAGRQISGSRETRRSPVHPRRRVCLARRDARRITRLGQAGGPRDVVTRHHDHPRRRS